MIDEKKLIEDIHWKVREQNVISEEVGHNRPFCDKANVIKCINNQPKIGEWILCSEKLPKNEQEVEITYTREHYLTGEKLYLTARAFYEDGTYTTEDSAYNWNETDNWECDEKTDACIIPQGWFESVSFTDEFGIVDMPVIAWKPIAKPYKP